MLQFNPSRFIGTDLPGVTILEELGHGSMGAVYVGFQRSLKRKVAVKIVPRQSVIDASVRVRFRDEAQTVAVLTHPGIIPLIDMGETDEVLYLIMQLIEGDDLKTIIRNRLTHPLPHKRTSTIHEALQVIIPVLDALNYAHDQGVVHRDVKPANILIDKRYNRPYLADFGIAKAEDLEELPGNFIMGTPLFMAPEQLSSGEADPRSDIYSAGLVLFEMLAGKLPLQTTILEKIIYLKSHDPGSIFTATPSMVNRAIDNEFESYILKAIAPEPDKRYQKCASFLRDLEHYRESHRLTDTLPTGPAL